MGTTSTKAMSSGEMPLLALQVYIPGAQVSFLRINASPLLIKFLSLYQAIVGLGPPSAVQLSTNFFPGM